MLSFKALSRALAVALGVALPHGAAVANDLPAGAFDRAVTSAWPNVSSELAGRIRQDETLQACSAARNQPAPDVARAIEARETTTLRLPPDGVFMGDWKKGEAGALSGYGLRMGDDARRANGGNCFACHQMTSTELSYGTLGPSLLGYGKLAGNDLATQQRVYAKIFNPQASLACSSMPRFGSNGVLTIDQIKDFVAYLLHPESPVNR